MKELTEAIAGYLDHIWMSLADRLGRRPNGDYSSAKVRFTPAAAQRWFEEEFEKDSTWDKLVRTCAEIFSKEGHDKRKWGGAIRNWMRRGGTYLSLLDGVRPNPAEVAEALLRDGQATEDRVVFLAPLEGMGFTKTEMDFGDFQILQPNAEQLELLLGMPANRIFYPYAATSTKRLTDHWYIRCEMREGRKLGHTYDPLALVFGGPVLPEYTHLPPRIEAPLKSLILWDEQPYGLGIDSWIGFISIPFVIIAQDNPFKAPRPAPPIGHFRFYQPIMIDDEEIGEEPGRLIDLAAEDTIRFEVFIREVTVQLQKIRSRGEPWEFVDHGLNYLLKGFFSDGLDQLIWHIVALEAFLGEKDSDISLTEQLSKRVAAIHSGDSGRSEAASKEFKNLYKIRLLSQKCLVLSARIHGSRGPRPRNGCFGFSADFQQAVGRAGGPRWRQPRAPGGCPLSAWPCC
jgi:hypothetical protein